jgi:Holliday junction resolvase RusA-like endonuclease
MGEEFRTPFVVVPFLPPTSNNIYVTGRNGIRFLSKEADSFKKRAITLIASEQQSKIVTLNPTGLYRVWYNFFFEDKEIINKTFGSGKKDAASSRYKKMDVENRIKLVADSFSKAIGIDDSQFFEGGHTKLCASLVGGSPQIHIFLAETEPGRFGL